ncbi:MAG: IclR family transcriptional regulator [Stappiaceae bacterium]
MLDPITELEPRKKDYTIDAVARALALLEALGEHPGQGVSELARTLGLTKSIVFRLLYTLEERGFVSRDEDRTIYSLGYRVGVLGERVGRDGTLMHVAPPMMDTLRDQTGENVNLVVRQGYDSVALATREGYNSIRLYAKPGRKGPLHAGGGSLLMFAFADEELIEEVLSQPLQSYTPYTITDPEKVRQVLGRIRRQGYNVSLNDLDDGAFSIAAPIRDAGGRVIAGLSIAGAMVRFDEERRENYLAAVIKAADAISSKLAFR